MEILGYLCALLVGISLGLLGGGGSILAVPIFAYLFKLDSVESTAYSLFVVGSIALMGSFQKTKDGFVNWPVALLFGLPTVAGVWLMRGVFLPALPDEIFTISNITLTKRMLMFGVFAVIMILAARNMLKNKVVRDVNLEKKGLKWNLILQGFFLGMLTGFVGAGGGFLIVPILMYIAGLSIKEAIGTSLVIITVNSLGGFLLGDALHMEIDWIFLLKFTGLAILGLIIGNQFSKKIDGSKLQQGFAYFIMSMAAFIFFMEFVMHPS